MLDNDTHINGQLAEMKMKSFHQTADQLRMASLLKKRESKEQRNAVTFILHETGKALVNTGQRLLEIA